jgi:L-ascorbate metabolism protein UlaG (beta-lactamase superfamily)
MNVLTIRYLGHSAFALDDGKRHILVDPFLSDNPSAAAEAEQFHPDVILLTHAHNDHVGDTVEIAKRSNAMVVATHELATYLGQQGVNANGGNFGGTIRFDGGSAKFVPAWHTSSYQTAEGFVAPGVPAGYVVRFGGKTIYFAGDTCLFSDMSLIGEEGLDLAVLPIGDQFTMGPKDAVRAVSLLKPKVVIPCHYDTFEPIKQDAQAFVEDVEERTTAKAVALNPGETYELRD